MSAVATDSPAIESPSRRGALVAAGTLIATGVALAVAFFPLMFNEWLPRDDEGVFVFALREFLNHQGHLYSTVWSDMYGPFYYLTMSTVFRVIHQQPTLENGRWIVLVLTTASAVLFGASVWRVTKSLPCSLVCETGAFLLLISIAGNEPMHPGSLGVFLVAVVSFELSSYAATRSTAHLVAIGAATGALMMTKVNAGGLVAVALVFALVVGNRNTPRWIQAVVAVMAALFPIALVSQNLSQKWAATFAAIVIISIIAMFAIMSADQLPLPRWSLLPAAYGALGAIVVSLAFPVVTGTPLSDEISGAFIRPLALPNAFTVPANVSLEWMTLVLALGGVCAAVVFGSLSRGSVRNLSGWTNATLVALALWLLGLGATVLSSGFMVARWLPGLVVLPALAFCADRPEPIRFALRSAVLLATLQILVAYPVAGSQVGWGSVAMMVPCAIALAAGIDHSRAWREATPVVRRGATAFVCIAMIVASSVWPLNVWNTYRKETKLGLPGTGLMRIDPVLAATVQAVTQALRAQCDTFYGVPNQNSFYIFSGLPAVTAMVANGGTTALTVAQQGRVIAALEEKSNANERVCILRDSSQSVVVPAGALTDVLNQYATVVASVGSWTISRRG